MNDDENEANDPSDDQGFVLIANEILRKCKIHGEVQYLKECSDSFFVAIYEGILGEALVGITSNAVSFEQRISNCDKVIDALSHEVLNVDLSHITGENIVAGDISTIQNLLEIFKELLDFILDVDEEFHLEDVDEQNDSNLLSSDHEVISDVLQEEFGQLVHDRLPLAGNNLRFPPNREYGGVLSSNSSTIGEPEVSSIPKCSDGIPSSRNSDAESNSTDEIIRESELLERQLSRDYPSLRQLRDQRESGHRTGRFRESEKELGSLGHGEKLSRDKTHAPNLPTISGDMNSVDLPARVRRKFDRKKDDRVNEGDDVRNSQKKNACLGGRGGLGTLGDVNVPKTGRTLNQGISEAVDDVHIGTLKDSNVHGTRRSDGISEAVDDVYIGTLGNTSGTVRDTQVPKTGRRFGGNSDGIYNVHRLRNDFRKPVTVPTGSVGEVYTGKDSNGLRGRTVRDVGGSTKGREESGYRENGGQQSAFVFDGDKRKSRLIEHEDDRDIPSTSLGNTRPDAVLNRKELSMHTRTGKDQTEFGKKSDLVSREGTTIHARVAKDHTEFVRKSDLFSQEGTKMHARAAKDHNGFAEKSDLLSHEGMAGLDVKIIDAKQSERTNQLSKKDLRTNEPKKNLGKATSCDLSTVTSSKERSRLFGKHADFRKDQTKKDMGVEKRVQSSTLGTGTDRVHRGGRGSLDDSNGRGNSGGKKGKENKRPRGILKDQDGSKVERKGTKDSARGSTRDKGRRRQKGDLVKSVMAEEQKGETATYEDNDAFVQRRTKVTEDIKEHTDGSESSGVFWDDQISPLDVSEGLRHPRQGLAFDEVGSAKKSTEYEARRGLGKNKDTRDDSPVVRHYHHHFHHGSSEDLVRDVSLSERAQMLEKEIAGSRNVQGLGSSFSRHDLKDVKGESRLAPRKGLMKKDEVSPKKRSVKFDEHVDTLLITNRLERLRKELDQEDDEQHEKRSQIRNGYSGYLDRLNKEHRRMENELKQKPKKIKRPSPYRKKRSVSFASRDRAQAVYSKPTNQRKARYPSTKARKRSSSASPKIRHKRKAAKQLEKGDIILPTLLDEFPYLHLSPHTLQTMRRKQTGQLLSLSKSAQVDKRQTKTQKVIEDAEKRQQTLLKILRKDLQHNQRMREQKDRKEQERAISSKLREKRHASARARRYYEDYQLRMRARMLKRRTKEEQVFKNLFEDGLEIQKQRVHELRTYAKEQREMRAVRQQNELESLENYYRDQYSILAEAIAQEKETLLVREKAQEKVIHQMQHNLREKLQKEVTDIQETLVRDEDDAHFRRLDAERLRKQLQMTAFQNLS